MSVTRIRSCSVIALGALLALAACGDDDEAEVEVAAPGARAAAGSRGAPAAIDSATAQLALDELAANVDVTVTGFGSAEPAPAPSSPASAGAAAPPSLGAGGTVDVRCAAGGTASIAGYVNVVPAPLDVDVKVAIDYASCVTSTGTTITGQIDFSQTLAAGAATPLRIETIYQGEVTLTGRINATCTVDLNVLVDERGLALEVAGSLCGQDASGLTLQLNPRWAAQ